MTPKGVFQEGNRAPRLILISDQAPCSIEQTSGARPEINTRVQVHSRITKCRCFNTSPQIEHAEGNVKNCKSMKYISLGSCREAVSPNALKCRSKNRRNF